VLGALIAVTTMPGVPVDDELLVVLAVGLGVYRAWVHRDWSNETTRVGLAAAGAGAFVGFLTREAPLSR